MSGDLPPLTAAPGLQEPETFHSTLHIAPSDCTVATNPIHSAKTARFSPAVQNFLSRVRRLRAVAILRYGLGIQESQHFRKLRSQRAVEMSLLPLQLRTQTSAGVPTSGIPTLESFVQEHYLQHLSELQVFRWLYKQQRRIRIDQQLAELDDQRDKFALLAARQYRSAAKPLDGETTPRRQQRRRSSSFEESEDEEEEEEEEHSYAHHDFGSDSEEEDEEEENHDELEDSEEDFLDSDDAESDVERRRAAIRMRHGERSPKRVRILDPAEMARMESQSAQQVKVAAALVLKEKEGRKEEEGEDRVAAAATAEERPSPLSPSSVPSSSSVSSSSSADEDDEDDEDGEKRSSSDLEKLLSRSPTTGPLDEEKLVHVQRPQLFRDHVWLRASLGGEGEKLSKEDLGKLLLQSIATDGGRGRGDGDGGMVSERMDSFSGQLLIPCVTRMMIASIEAFEAAQAAGKRRAAREDPKGQRVEDELGFFQFSQIQSLCKDFPSAVQEKVRSDRFPDPSSFVGVCV